MRKCSFLIVSVLCSFYSTAQTWRDTVNTIEKTMSAYQPQNPGCQLSISRNGKVIFSKAWGMADLEHNITLTTTSIIEAGSVSKQFTAAAILLLEQQGKLSLEDDVRKYIPELPDYGASIKLRHMMHHTSGFRDWGAVAALTGWPRSTKAYSNDDALEIIAQQKRLNNKPGDEFIYSNSNFNLLAIIVHRVSGLSLAAFTRKYIFEPAGMTHTQWRDNFNRIVLNRAIAYQKTTAGFEMDMPNEYVYGNGGLLTTTEDLLKWNEYFLHGRFGSPSLLSTQITAEPFSNGLMSNYGAGLFIEKFRGWNMIDHTGATASYRAYLENFPQLDLSIAFLSNSSQFDTSEVNASRMIKNIFIKNIATEITKPGRQVTVSDEKLAVLTGWYRNDRTGEGLQIILNKNRLTIDGKTPLIPAKESLFFTGTNQLAFENTGGMKYIITGRDTINYTKVDSSTAISPEHYTGKYFSEETRSYVIIKMKDNVLVMHIKPGVDYNLISAYKDAFAIKDMGGTLYFQKDKENKIARMNISISRARNVEFVRVD